MTHQELIARAGRWLLNSRRCEVVLYEPVSWTAGEIPDAIGWHTGIGIVVECKTCLSDFYADQRKPWRAGRGLGRERWYLAVPNLAARAKAIIRPPWGLLACHPKQIRVVAKALPVSDDHWNGQGECDILVKRAVVDLRGVVQETS